MIGPIPMVQNGAVARPQSLLEMLPHYEGQPSASLLSNSGLECLMNT
jgi:hypothetical protein